MMTIDNPSAVLVAKDLVVDGGFANERVVAARVGPRLSVVIVVFIVVGGDFVIVVVFVVAVVVVLVCYDVDLAHEGGTELEEDAFAVGTASVLLQLLSHRVNG
jgi:hypothetical protein